MMKRLEDETGKRKKIVVVPEFDDKTALDDFVSRCAWYYRPYAEQIEGIYISIKAPIGRDITPPEGLDPEISNILPRVFNIFKFSSPDTEATAGVRFFTESADILIGWRKLNHTEQRRYGTVISSAKRDGGFFDLDVHRSRNEGSLFLWSGLNRLADREQLVRGSREKLRCYAGRFSGKKAYVFGTGPSLASVCSHDFSDGACIVANSMVKNRALLDQLNPVAIAAGDPIFHAGCSRYAAEFRDALRETMSERNVLLFVPLRDYPIYLSNLPDVLHDRIIGVPFEEKNPYNLNLLDEFYVNPLPNILTLLLIPLASTFFSEICVVGCDGRPLEDDQYFWAHDKASQFNDSMQNIRDVHPAFFAIDYNDYYNEHCNKVAEIVGLLERAGKRVSSLTASYIPALRDRCVDADGSTEKVAEIISIDPDGVDHHGHFLSYDRKLAEAARAKGVGFSLLANRRLREDIEFPFPDVERVFTSSSWTIGNQPAGPDPDRVREFKTELEHTLFLRRSRGIRRKAVLYMYCGSLPHARAICEVMQPYVEYSANINLFWTSFMAYEDPAYIKAWKAFLVDASKHDRLTLTVPTPRLQKGFVSAYEVELTIAPHPSTTFSDSQNADIHSCADSAAITSGGPSAVLGRDLTVSYLGGASAEKGINLTPGIIRAVDSLQRTGFKHVVRFVDKPGIPMSLRSAIEDIRYLTPHVVEGEMTDNVFGAFLARSDIIVLPYRSKGFSERTSGLLIDALILGKPVVVFENTWLADIVQKYGFGLVVPDGDTDAMARAIISIGEDDGRFREAAVTARVTYCHENSWKALVDSIMTGGHTPNVIESSEDMRCSGFSEQIRPNVDIPVHAAGAVTYHHRGTYRNVERLRYTMRQSETLVVLGNGPSLRSFDFERFRPFDVIGMNAAYRYWDEIRWYPNYYICLDKVVGQSHKEPIIRLIRTRRENGIRLFVLRRNLIDLFPEDIRGCEAILDFDALKEAMLLFAPMPITTGSHASLVGAMLGYQHMIIMGVDCNYVEKVDGAVERGGTVLEIAETPSENPNYFFTGYQIEGDQYNIPNSIGPNLHLDSWRAVAPVLAERGIEVWNGSEISRVDVFPYHDFSDVEKLGSKAREGATTAEQRITVVQQDGNLPAYERDAHACVDEAKFVSTLFGPSAGAERIMIDVGAHFGGSAQHFVDRGWKIYCFEPDPANRERLVAKFGRTPSIVIDSRAVGGKPESGKAFFSSSESTGISGLSAFHHTHRQVDVVDVTTIADIVEQHGLSRIDFLKIDVEGWDFFVLRGVPWDRIRPSVIECEFEDAKTVPLGHNYKDMADFLVGKGYVVYVSEWHPIVRYGVRHDWCRLIKYPEPLRTPQAWGNLLAFLEDPGPRAIAEALGVCVSATNSRNNPVKPTPRPQQASGVLAKEQQAAAPAGQKDLQALAARQKGAEDELRAFSKEAARVANSVGPPKANVAGVRHWQQVFSLALLWKKLRRWAAPGYMEFASWVKTRSRVLFRIGQFVMWSLRAARRRPLALLGLLFALAVLTATPAYPPMWEYRIFFWGAAGALLLSALGVIGVAVAEMAVRRLLKLQRVDVEARLRAVRRGSDSRTAALEARVTALGKNLQALAARQRGAEEELHALQQQAAALAGQKDLQALAARQRSAEEELRALQQQAAALAGQVECNAAFQRFNRVLTPAQVETLRNPWSKRLGLRLTGPSLAYIAHRIRNTEQNAVGRLATSIEDAVLRTLVSSAVKNDTLEVLEIGVLFGIGLGMIYENNRARYRSIHITAIDPVNGYYGRGEPDILLNIPVSESIFWHNMERAGVPRDDVTLIDALSTADGAIERASARKYDLLIIDGDHSYAGVKADFENYIDFVSRGGFIIFDDYGSADWPEVKRFVDEEVLTDSRVAHVGSEWKTAVFRVVKTSNGK